MLITVGTFNLNNLISRFNPPVPDFPEYELLDRIRPGDALSDWFDAAHIDCRRNLGGDGGDHDPAWIELAL